MTRKLTPEQVQKTIRQIGYESFKAQYFFLRREMVKTFFGRNEIYETYAVRRV